MFGGLLKSASSTALFAALGLIALGAGVPAAKAADLGGDCCADLEERVAELEATTARKGNRRMSLTISGQVQTHLMAWDDGIDNDVYVVDSTTAGGTLFQLAGNAKVTPALTAGFQVVVGLNVGARSHQVNQDDDDGNFAPAGVPANGDTQIVMTLANWYLDHKQLGRVTLGRINTATAGATTVDLGGAGVIANASIGYWQRGFFLTQGNVGLAGTWNDALGGSPVSGSSLSRANAISYTSPTFGGFSVSAAWGEDDIWDAALRYAGEFGGFRVAGAIGYISNSNGTNEIAKDDSNDPKPNQVKGSASILHVASGLYLTGAYLNQDNDVAGRPDTTLWYLQGGIGKNWTGLGKTVLYGEWAQVDDGINCGAGGCTKFGGNANDIITSSEATMWGLGVVQHVDAASMELYLSYRRYQAEVTSPAGNLINGTESFNDFDVVVGGARIRF